MSEQIYYNSDESVPFNNALVNATTVNATTVNTSNVNFGQSSLNYYKTANGVAVVMTDGTNTYSQNLQLERIGNLVKLTLRAIPISAIGAVSLIFSSTGISTEWRPAATSSFIVPGAFPGTAAGMLKLDITTGGVIQIRKTDNTAFTAGNIQYADLNVVYPVV
jgi:hypothetical protein